MIKKVNNYITKHGLLLIVVYAIVIRLAVFLFYNTINIRSDSQNYIDLAAYLTQFNLEGYPGNRTPGYPLLIALANNSLVITVIYQTILGFITTLLLFDFSKRVSKSVSIAFWVTFITSSFIHFVFYEFVILTETLSVFLVVLSFWTIEKHQLLTRDSNKKYYLLLSVILTLLYLTKPLFIYFSLGFAIFYFVKHFRHSLQQTFSKSIIVLLIPFLAYYGWNSLNKKNIGYFTNTYYFGINLAQTATSFFDKAPQEDALIRDIFVRNRDSIAEVLPDKYAMSVWFAHEELIEKTGLSPQNLAGELGRISKNLFKEHPDLYAKQVLNSFYLFFGNQDSIKWTYSFKNKSFRYILVRLWHKFEKHLLVLFNILFIMFSIKQLILFFKSKGKLLDMNLFIVCIVLSGALGQALVAFGSNSRFAFPFLPLIVYFVVFNIIDLKSKYLNLKK